MTDRPTAEKIEETNRIQQEFFDEHVDLFEPPLPEGVPERLETTIRESGLRQGERVLDVGTGTGILIPYILRYGPSEVHACDLAEKMLRRVRDKFPEVITHHCDVKDLPLPDGSLDMVFINACFSNIIDKQRSLDNLARLLHRKGRLVISHPMGRDFIVALKKKGTPFPLDLLPDEAEARELVGPHGFEIVSFRDEPLFYMFVAEAANRRESSGIRGPGPA